MSDNEEAKQLIGKTVTSADVVDEGGCNEVVKLRFSDGSSLTAGIGCGSTCEDYPHFSFYVETPAERVTPLVPKLGRAGH